MVIFDIGLSSSLVSKEESGAFPPSRSSIPAFPNDGTNWAAPSLDIPLEEYWPAVVILLHWLLPKSSSTIPVIAPIVLPHCPSPPKLYPVVELAAIDPR